MHASWTALGPHNSFVTRHFYINSSATDADRRDAVCSMSIGFDCVGFQTVEAGLATHLVPSQRLGGLQAKIAALPAEAASAEALERMLSSCQVSLTANPHCLLDC